MATGKRMSAEETVKKVQEAWSRNNADAVATLYAADAVVHDPMYPEPLRGREAVRKDFEEFWRGFPDLQFKFSDTLARGETAAMQAEVTGTHKGPLTGPTGTIDPTNKRMSMNVAVFLRLNAQSQVVEERRYFDTASMMQQLGLTG